MADAMDSKSISRKGVGVQVPASAPIELPSFAPAADRSAVELEADPFVRAALPVLLHRLNNAAQIVLGVNALLGLGARADVLDARAGDLAQVARDYADSGWLLGLCAAALGGVDRFERRDRDGLDVVFRLCAELARRRGCSLELAGELPRLRADAGVGWECSWAVGSWLHALAEAAPSGACVRVVHSSLDGRSRLTDDAPWTELRAQRAANIGACVAGLHMEPATHALEIEPSWLASGQSNAALDVPT